LELDRYLTKRKGERWQLRVPVPRRLHASYGRKEVTKSLGTADKTEATKRAVRFVEGLHREWAQLEAIPEARPLQRPSEELVEITAVEYAHVLLLKDFDQKRSALARMDPEQFAEHRREREQRLEQRKRDVAVGNFEPMLPAARMIVQRERWDLPETDPRFHRFCGMLAEANLATFKTHAARLEGDIHAVSEDAIIRRVGSRRTTNAPAGERLIDLVQLYKTTSEREGRKRADTIVQDDKLLRLFAEFVGGDRRVSSISKDEARDFRNTLASVPS
jgi:hypothetical protein